MSQTSSPLAQAQQLIEGNLVQACADALELKATGVLPQGPLREALAGLKQGGVDAGALSLVQSIVHDSAMRSVLNHHKGLSLQVLPY